MRNHEAGKSFVLLSRALAGFLALLSALLQDYAAFVACKVYTTEALAMSVTLSTILAEYIRHIRP